MRKTISLFCVFITLCIAKIYSQNEGAYVTYVGEVELYLYTIVWSDGSFYTGGVSNFTRDPQKIDQVKRNGFGSLVIPAPKETYTGYWKNDLKHGPGIFIQDNKVYKSFWMDGEIIQDSTVRVSQKEIIDRFIAEGRAYEEKHFFTPEELKSMNPNLGAMATTPISPLPFTSRKFPDGFPESFIFKRNKQFPMYAYETIHLDTLYTEKSPIILSRINLSSTPHKDGKFHLLEVLAGHDETWSTYLVTLDENGEIIDILLSAVCFYNDLFIKKATIHPSGEISIHSLKIVKSNYKYAKNIKDLIASKFTEVYQITPSGKFLKVKETTAPAITYTKAHLQNF